MYVAEDGVDVLAIHKNLRAARFGKEVGKFLAGDGVDIHGHDFISRNHAVAHMGRRKIERVLEYLHLVFNGLLVFGEVVDCFLKVIVEVAYRNESQTLVAVLDAHKAHERTRKIHREERYGIEYDIEKPDREGKHL